MKHVLLSITVLLFLSLTALAQDFDDQGPGPRGQGTWQQGPQGGQGPMMGNGPRGMGGMRGMRGQGGMKGMRGQGGGQCQNMIHKDLDLTEDQQVKLLEVKKEQQKEMKNLQRGLQDLRAELEDVLGTDNVDESKAKKIAKKIGEATTKQIEMRVTFVKKLSTILNKDQLRKMNLDRMFKGPGMGQGGRPGRAGQGRQ